MAASSPTAARKTGAAVQGRQTTDERPAAALVIRPMDFGGVVDTGIALARHNYRDLVIIAAWAMVPAYAVFGVVAALLVGTTTGITGVAVGTSISGVALAIGSGVAEVALVLACARLIGPNGDGAGLAPGPLYGAAVRRIPAVIALAIIVTLTAIPLVIVFPLGIYVYIRWSVSWIALIVEGIGPIAALRRSRDLTRRSWWHAFVVLLAGSIVFGIISFVLGGSIGFVASFVSAASGNVVAAAFLNNLSSAVSSILVAPFSTAYLVVLYYELRARTEGYDLQQRAAQVAGGE